MSESLNTAEEKTQAAGCSSSNNPYTDHTGNHCALL